MTFALALIWLPPRSAAASVVAALGACLSHWPTCPPRAGDPSCERAGEVASCQHRCNPALPARSSQLQRAWHHETSLESPSPDLLAFSIHPLRGPPAAAIFKPSRRRRPTTAAVCVSADTPFWRTPCRPPAGLPRPRGGRLLSAFSEQAALVRPLPARPWVSRARRGGGGGVLTPDRPIRGTAFRVVGSAWLWPGRQASRGSGASSDRLQRESENQALPCQEPAVSRERSHGTRRRSWLSPRRWVPHSACELPVV